MGYVLITCVIIGVMDVLVAVPDGVQFTSTEIIMISHWID